jgi:hypothetical protein
MEELEKYCLENHIWLTIRGGMNVRVEREPDLDLIFRSSHMTESEFANWIIETVENGNQ